MLILLFKGLNFKASADKAECIKVKSSNKCLDLMRTKSHRSAARASWSDLEFSAYPRKLCHSNSLDTASSTESWASCLFSVFSTTC